MDDDAILRERYPSMFSGEPATPGTTDVLTPAGGKTEEELHRQMYPSMFGPTAEAPSPPAPAPAAPTAAAPAASPPSAETTATVENLKLLGVELPAGLDPAQGIAFHDAAIKAHVAQRDAEVAAWEAESLKLPPAEIEAATAFAREHLDDALRDVLISSGLGSHPGIVKLAAKLSAALSRR